MQERLDQAAAMCHFLLIRSSRAITCQCVARLPMKGMCVVSKRLTYRYGRGCTSISKCGFAPLTRYCDDAAVLFAILSHRSRSPRCLAVAHERALPNGGGHFLGYTA